MAATAFELHVDAERELDAAIAMMEDARDGRGMRFLDSFDLAIRTIMNYPEIGRRSARFRIFVMASWKR